MEAQSLSPHSNAEIEKLISLVRIIPEFSQLNRDEQDNLIDDLSDFECYAQVIRLLEWRISEPSESGNHMLEDYYALMRVYYEGLEDFDSFLDVAIRCVRDLSPSFATVRLHIADQILGPYHFEEHAILFRALEHSFQETAQRVLLLLRLALITEKKLFHENQVEPLYRRILELDPKNTRALRFYRMWHTQGGEWLKATHYMQRLIGAYRNPHEKQRAAHELAQIYLYSLNQPDMAKQVLLSHCTDSHLDTRGTLIEALERLGDYDELLACLADICNNSAHPEDRAAALLKEGQVLIKLGRIEDSKISLRKSLEIFPDNLLAHETLINTLVIEENISELKDSLTQMAKHLSSNENKKTLLGLVQNLEQLPQKTSGIVR